MKRTHKTVLFLSHDLSRSGAPLMLLNFLRWFGRTCDMKIRVLAGRPGDLLSDFAAVGQVDCFEPNASIFCRALHRLNLYPTQASSRRIAVHLSGLRHALVSDDIQLIYANSVASAKMVQFLSFLNCPVICHIHELESSIRLLGAPNLDVVQLLKERSSKYIAVSDAVKINLVNEHGVPASKIEVVLGLGPPSAGHLAKAVPSRDLRRELAIPEKAKLVCGCGSIEPRKGTDLFLEVAAHVTRSYGDPPIHFVWVGGRSDEVSRMRREVSASGLNACVHFVGEKLDVTPYFDASELVLLTSREESLSLVMLEAALREKPIICFERSGHPPEFVQGGSGVAIPDFDPKKMAEKLMEILSTPGICKLMGQTAKQKALNRYDFNSGASRIAQIIGSTLQGHAGKTNRADALGSR